MFIRAVLVFLLLCLRLVTGLAQEKQRYTLQEAIDIGIKNNPRLLIAKREIESAKAKKLQSLSLENPKLGLAWEGIESGSPISKANERTVAISQGIEFPVKLFLRSDIANRDVDIAVENLGRVGALVTTEVKKGYYKVSYLQKQIETLDFTLGLLKQFQEATLVKYQSGELPYFEVVRAKVEFAKTQNEIIELKKELTSAKSEFNLLLGKSGFEEFELVGPIAYVPFGRTRNEVVDELMKQNRSLKIAGLSQQRESKSLSLAKSRFIPDLNFSGGFFSESGGKFIPSFQIGATLPLWWWNPKGQVQESRANLNIAEIRKATTERTVRSAIEKNYELVRASEDQILLFEKTLLREADEELKAGINSYQYNQIDALGLLDIYRTNKTTKTEYYRALFNYLSALADLEVAGEESE